MTMTFPVARAGPIFQLNIKTRKTNKSDAFNGESRSGKERTREVPGDDLTNDTDRLMDGVDEFPMVGLDGLTVDLVGPASIVSEGRDGKRNVCVLRPLEGFA